MYNLSMPIINKEDRRIPIIKKLFREILGYSEKEIQQFIDTKFMCIVVKNISLEQAKLIIKPFYDNEIQMGLKNINNIYISYHDAGFHIDKETPKQHYYDTPVVSRDHLVDPYTQKEKERQQNIQQNRVEQATKMYQNQPKCPTCQSTNISKIGTFGRMASVGFWGLASNKINKSFKCKNCGYTW